jgi:hypothetical protein
MSSSCQTEFRSPQHFERQTKSKPKASFRPKGRSGHGNGREEFQNSLRRHDPLPPNSFAGSVKQLTWYIVLPITWTFPLSGFPGNLDHPSFHILRMTEWLRYHKTRNNSHMCNMAINIEEWRPWVFLPSPSSCGPARTIASSFLRLLNHTRRTTVGRTPLDRPSARHRDLYLTTYNNHCRQTSISPVEFEPAIWAGERPQTYWDRAATETGLRPWALGNLI